MKRLQPDQDRLASVRADGADVEAMLERLDGVARGDRPAKRKHKRFSYRATDCTVTIAQPGSGRSVTFSVPTRNLSSEGISFIHGGFVHPGSACLVQLETVNGSTLDVPAKVVRARYVGNWMHEVSLQFAAPIRPGDVCGEADQVSILLVEPDDAMGALAERHLRDLGADVERVIDAGAIVRRLGAEDPPECVLLGAGMDGQDGAALAAQLRAAKYAGTIIVMAERMDPDIRERGLRAGCDQVLSKLYTPEHLRMLMASQRRERLDRRLLDDEKLGDIVMEFVISIPGRIRRLEDALLRDAFEDLRSAVGELKTRAAACGFRALSEHAVSVERRLLAENTAALAAELESLIGECMLARSATDIVREG